MSLVDPDFAYRRAREEEDERAQLRAEYFEQGGVVHRYPHGAQGRYAMGYKRWMPRGQKEAARAASRKHAAAKREGSDG